MYENRDKTGDITFKVGTKEIKAHKCVLAALSPMYMGQFYGDFEDAKKDEIEITDVSAAAFEEYLQFFYLDQVRLTHQNIRNVLKLTDPASEEFSNECFNFLIETLSVENVCQTYQLAVTYDCTGLIECCEHEISSHADEVFLSDGFLRCTRGDLFNILQSDSLNCKETEVFDACILWAKNSCILNDLDPEKVENLRKTLTDGDLLYQIRFGAMKFEEFMKCCYKKYKELFTEDEREEIFYMISKDSDVKPEKFNDEPREYVRFEKWDEKKAVQCDRVIKAKPTESFHYGIDKTVFFTDRPILLGGFYCGSLFKGKENEKRVAVNVSIIRKQTQRDTDGKTILNTTEELTFKTGIEAFVDLRRPIMIKTDFVYEIQLEIRGGFSVTNYDFKHEVVVGLSKPNTYKNSFPISVIIPGTQTVIKFPETQGLVTRLKLNICQEREDELDQLPEALVTSFREMI